MRPAPRIPFGVILAAWAALALALAVLRVPFDDEQFSIELAFQATRSQLWAALQNDVHPPWLALLDRALAQLGPAAFWLQAARVLFGAAALALASHALAQPLGLPRGLFVLAAAHPIVLFYTGAARWYPLFWLAHALRLAAIWHPRPAGRVSATLFISGSVLGSSASYLDPLFVAHDSLWLALRSARVRGPARAAWLRVLSCVAAAVAGIALLRSASPLQGSVHSLTALQLPHWQLRDVAAWGALGLSGEAALPWPWLALGATCVIAAGWGWLCAMHAPATRAASLWLASYAGCWLLACGFGVDHPRYALLLWAVVPCLWLRWLLPTAAAPSALRALSSAALVHLGLGLGLVIAGQGFFKTDLNALAAEDCAPLTAAADARAVLVTYARLEQLVRNQCASSLPLVRLRSIRIVPDPHEQLADLEELLRDGGSLWLLSIHTEASYARTADRVRARLSAQCSAQSAVDFGRIPHPGLSARRSASYRRFKLEQFACPSHSHRD